MPKAGGAWAFYAPFVGLMVFDATTLAQWGWKRSCMRLVAPRLLEASITYDPPSLASRALHRQIWKALR